MSKKVIIIAEAGVNHNGDINLAFRLIEKAKESGADYVKFQTFIPELLVSKDAKKADYQVKNTDEGGQQGMLRKLALTFNDFHALNDYCKQLSIGFLSTGFDEESVKFIDSLGVDFHKVPSGEITNLPYLQLISSFGKKVILSTGMADFEEVRTAVDILCSGSLTKSDIIVLQCTTEYPAPAEEANLLSIVTLKKDLGVETGYSDHTQGIEIPIAAVALGATVIEKHFTLDRMMPGPDHKASLEPAELKEMVRCIRNVELAIGTGVKVPSDSEIKNIAAARRSIHTNHPLTKGTVLSASDLIMKRPGTGISPMRMGDVIGKKLKVDLPEDFMINWSDIE